MAHDKFARCLRIHSERLLLLLQRSSYVNGVWGDGESDVEVSFSLFLLP